MAVAMIFTSRRIPPVFHIVFDDTLLKLTISTRLIGVFLSQAEMGIAHRPYLDFLQSSSKSKTIYTYTLYHTYI